MPDETRSQQSETVGIVSGIFGSQPTPLAEMVLGVVVVGIGRAGKARIRDIQQHILGEDVVLRGIISR